MLRTISAERALANLAASMVVVVCEECILEHLCSKCALCHLLSHGVQTTRKRGCREHPVGWNDALHVDPRFSSQHCRVPGALSKVAASIYRKCYIVIGSLSFGL